MEVTPSPDQQDFRELSETEKLARAKEYWSSRLEGEHRIETPQNPRCEFAVVVPVYNERPERLLKQLDSLRRQSLDPDLYEIIYVVNNDVPRGISSNEGVLRQNTETMQALRSVTDLPVRVIDKSSAGNEINGCNVGRARNRGLAEASLRFYESGKNGIIVQTDADTYFEDEELLEKIQAISRDNPDVIGMAGGLIFEFSPDSDDAANRNEISKKIDMIILQKTWSILKNFLFGDKKGYSPVADTTFSGANMISKSFESAVIGGLIDANKGEDPRFGQDLTAYARYNHCRVIGVKESVKVVTAIRESDRTDASFRRYFDNIDPDKPIVVSDPEAAKAGVRKKLILDAELIEKYKKMAEDKEGGRELLIRLRKVVEEIRLGS